MKRTRQIVADDGDVRVEITVRVNSRNGLVRHEVDSLARDLTRRAGDALRGARYTDFGIENTRVR